MGRRVTVTARDGNYLLRALPPGDYTVTFALAGFRRASAAVRVDAGLAASLDAILQIATLVESVTVAPRPGVIDRHTTAVRETFTQEQLAALPGSRSMFAVLSSTPGIQVARFEVGGNTGDAGGPYSAYGNRGSNRPTVEGMLVTQIFPLGFTLDYGAFEEVAVRLAAHGPEWPVPGVHVQFIGKSGGNQYRATAYGDFEHPRWQSYNIDGDQQRRGQAAGGGLLSRDANRMWRSYDINADLGGYVVRDRAWWYGSVRDQDVQLRQVNFPVKPSQTRLRNYTGKATLRARTHTVVGFAQFARNRQPNRLDPFGPSGGRPLNAATAIHDSEDATSRLRVSGIVWKAEWNATVGERLFAEVRAGQFDVRRSLTPNGDAPRFEDIDTLQVTGGGRHSERRLRRNQVQASASYFRQGWAGSHQFKAGGEIFDTVTEDRLYAAFPGGVLHVTRSGQPAEIYRFFTPSASASGLMAAAAHAGDSWGLTDRITLDLGIRFDRYRVFLPAQAPPPGLDGQPVAFAPVDGVVRWNLFAPRIGGVFDPVGDGKTLLKGSYGWYWLTPGDVGPNVNPNAAEWWRRYLWRDLNANGTWEPGEEGPLRDSRGGRAVDSIDPNLRAPWDAEATAFVERELPAAVGIRTGVVWRHDSNHYARQNLARPFSAFSDPVVIPDPGPDGLSGTPDDGPGLSGYNLRVDQLPAAGAPANVVRNIAGSDSRYLTWEVAAHRRMQGRWSLSAGFAHTWTLEHANAYGGQAVRQNEFVLTPDDLINTSDGGRHRMRTWTATASGTFRGPWKILLTPLLRHQSGQPFGRTLSASMNFGVIRVLAEPIGTRRTDNVTLLDVRLEREVRRAGSRRFSVFVDVFNLLNANPEQEVNWSSGAAFLQPLTVVAPRIARVGLRGSF